MLAWNGRFAANRMDMAQYGSKITWNLCIVRHTVASEDEFQKANAFAITVITLHVSTLPIFSSARMLTICATRHKKIA
jgi:hypothetical protein